MSRQPLFWRRTAVLSVIACGVLAAGAAAVALEWFPISGTMTLNSGGTAQISGEMAFNGSDSYDANIDTGGADISSGGSVEITLPDGSKATLVVDPSNNAACPAAPATGKND